jgi:hypothetical protein
LGFAAQGDILLAAMTALDEKFVKKWKEMVDYIAAVFRTVKVGPRTRLG